MSVVVGFDGSPASRNALMMAADEARLRGLDVDVVTAWQPPTVDLGMGMGAVADPQMADVVRDRATAMSVEAAADLIDQGLRALAVADAGPAAAVLLQRSEGADLLVVGADSRGALGHLLAGSTSRQVAAHATCPVICVRARADADRGVVVGIDGSAPAGRALDFAFDEASRRGWPLRVVHAWDVSVIGFDVDDTTYPAGGILDDIRDVESRLSAEVLAGHRARYPDVEVDVRIERGPAAGILVEACESAGMLVVGSRGRGGFAALLLGSVSHKVLHHAPCSVAIVP